MKNNINIAYSPNNTWRDSLQALMLLILPWNWFRWKKGRAVSHLQNDFREYFGVKRAWAVASGREALYLALKSLQLDEDDEVIVQGFTCMVVINAIIWNNAMPRYADIDAETYNLTVESIKKVLTPKTRVIIVQHTFGIPAQIEKIRAFCDEHNLILLEDCAHAMGTEYDGKLVGTFGDLSIFSMGRSKCISCVSGGMIISPKGHYEEEIAALVKEAAYPGSKEIFQNLMHAPVAVIAKPLYNFFKLGRVLLVICQKLGLLNMEVTRLEKSGIRPKEFGRKLPNALALIARTQFVMLNKFNEHRREIATLYYRALKKGMDPASCEGASYLRYPLQVNDRNALLLKAKSRGIVLGDWYASVIAPPDIDINKTHYQTGQCGIAETVCENVVNLPTYHNLSVNKAKSIINLFQ